VIYQSFCNTKQLCCIHQRKDADRTYLRCPIRAWIRLRYLQGESKVGIQYIA